MKSAFGQQNQNSTLLLTKKWAIVVSLPNQMLAASRFYTELHPHRSRDWINPDLGTESNTISSVYSCSPAKLFISC